MSPFATYTHAFDHVGVIGTYVDSDAEGKESLNLYLLRPLPRLGERATKRSSLIFAPITQLPSRLTKSMASKSSAQQSDMQS